jgi:hypothetical protein
VPPAPPPGPFTPRWSAATPNRTINNTFGYPLLAPGSATHTTVYRASHEFGTYNHGPIVSFWRGRYWMEWYNGVCCEGQRNRMLYATSADAVAWSRPSVMFNTTGTLVAEPPVEIEGRKYSLATSFAAFERTGPGAEHTGADTPLMRRVFSASQLGSVFWLGKSVPAGMEKYGYPAVPEMDAQTQADAAAYLGALVDTEPLSDWGQPNERAMYQLPADKRRLMLLLRAGNDGAGQHMLASSCELDAPAAAATAPPEPERQHTCRPITGLFNAGLPGDRMPVPPVAAFKGGDRTAPPTPWPGYHPIPVGKRCNWSAPTPTSIPDSHSRACTAPLPDGRVFMVGAQIPAGRDPLVLSLSENGLDWSTAYAVRVCDEASCKPRFGGPPGFQYPAALWKLDGPRGPEIIFSYSINREDIGLSRFPLSTIPGGKPPPSIHQTGRKTAAKTDDETWRLHGGHVILGVAFDYQPPYQRHPPPAIEGVASDCTRGVTLAPLSAAFVVLPHRECGSAPRPFKTDDSLVLPAKTPWRSNADKFTIVGDGAVGTAQQYLLPHPPFRMWYNSYNSTEAGPACARDDNNHMWSCNASTPVAPVIVPLDTLYPPNSYNVLYPGFCFPNSNTTEKTTGLLADWLDKRGVACMSWAPCWNVRLGNTTNDSTAIASFRSIIVENADRGATAIGLDECGDLRGRWGHLPGEIPGLKKMTLAGA